MDQVEGAPGFEHVELAAQFLDKARDLSGMDIRHQVYIQGCAVNSMNAAGHRPADQVGNRATAQRLDREYLRRWAAYLKVADLVDAALVPAG